MSGLARFSVVQPKGAASRAMPWLVVLSSDLVDGLSLVIVAPVRRSKEHGPVTRRLHVPVEIDGEQRVVVTEELVSLPKAALGKHMGTLAGYRDELTRALDFLFQGY